MQRAQFEKCHPDVDVAWFLTKHVTRFPLTGGRCWLKHVTRFPLTGEDVG
jgi:hypothetical protein